MSWRCDVPDESMLGRPSEPDALNELLPDSAARVLATLVVRYRHYDASEDAVQEP